MILTKMIDKEHVLIHLEATEYLNILLSGFRIVRNSYNVSIMRFCLRLRCYSPRSHPAMKEELVELQDP